MERDEEEHLRRTAMKVDLSDWAPNGSVYFDCGFEMGGDDCLINLTFVRSVEEIGRAHKEFQPRRSDWHRGVAVVAARAGVTGSQVKSFRRQFYRLRVDWQGYAFKTPDATGRIVRAVIDLLIESRGVEGASRVTNGVPGTPFRDALLGDELVAIRNAATRSGAGSDRLAARAQEVCRALDELVGGRWDVPHERA